MSVEDLIISSEWCCLLFMLICFPLHHKQQPLHLQSLLNRCQHLEYLIHWMMHNVCLCLWQHLSNITYNECYMVPCSLHKISQISSNSHWCHHQLLFHPHSIQILCGSLIRDLVLYSCLYCSNLVHVDMSFWVELDSLFLSLKCCHWSLSTQPKLTLKFHFHTCQLGTSSCLDNHDFLHFLFQLQFSLLHNLCLEVLNCIRSSILILLLCQIHPWRNC